MSAQAPEFVDTSILAYGLDAADPRKQAIAEDLAERLWSQGRGALSIQVLQELFVTLTKRSPTAMPGTEASAAVAALARWRCHSPRPSDVLAAIDLATSAQISFWDAMIIRSASQLGCDVAWSEDLNDGQTYAGVTVRNPFTA